MNHAPRYAVYWTPEPAHPLFAAGTAWLDPSTARAHTAAPRRYGFHATLKQPIALRDGCVEKDLMDKVHDIAERTVPFEMPALTVAALERFVALVPRQPVPFEHPLRRLADTCVQTLEPVRQASTPAELERRLKAAGDDAIRQDYAHRFGYPHVFDRWRFHMTLSDSLDDDALRQAVLAEAAAFFAGPTAQPLRAEAICVFVEPAPGAAFALVARHALQGA